MEVGPMSPSPGGGRPSAGSGQHASLPPPRTPRRSHRSRTSNANETIQIQRTTSQRLFGRNPTQMPERQRRAPWTGRSSVCRSLAQIPSDVSHGGHQGTLGGSYTPSEGQWSWPEAWRPASSAISRQDGVCPHWADRDVRPVGEVYQGLAQIIDWPHFEGSGSVSVSRPLLHPEPAAYCGVRSQCTEIKEAIKPSSLHLVQRDVVEFPV